MIIPNGKLIAIGGAEHRISKHNTEMAPHELDHFIENGILRRIVDEAGGIHARIEIITTASSVPYERGEEYVQSFTKIGCTNIGVMHIRGRQDMDEDCFHRINKCNGLLFTGGTQRRLSTVFSRTPFLETIKNRYYKEGLVVAGTSAGAMALGRIMIYKGTAMFTHLKGHVKTTSGFDLIHNVVFDSHFERSGRFARLAQLIALHTSCIGVGLGEDTGVLISEGNEIEVIGSGWVTIVDGQEIKHCNIEDIPNSHPPSIENIKVHFCAKGNGYLIKERKFIELINKKNKQVNVGTV